MYNAIWLQTPAVLQPGVVPSQAQETQAAGNDKQVQCIT